MGRSPESTLAGAGRDSERGAETDGRQKKFKGEKKFGRRAGAEGRAEGLGLELARARALAAGGMARGAARAAGPRAGLLRAGAGRLP